MKKMCFVHLSNLRTGHSNYMSVAIVYTYLPNKQQFKFYTVQPL